MPVAFKSVERWNRDMRCFQFFYAIGGHANDGDTIFGQILFQGEAELIQIFEKLGVPLQVIPDGAERVIPGRSYTSDQYAQIYHPILNFPKFQAPGVLNIWGFKVYLEVHQSDISVHLSGADGDPWSVTEQDFKNALHFENECQGLGIHMQKIAKD